MLIDRLIYQAVRQQLEAMVRICCVSLRDADADSFALHARALQAMLFLEACMGSHAKGISETSNLIQVSHQEFAVLGHALH